MFSPSCITWTELGSRQRRLRPRSNPAPYSSDGSTALKERILPCMVARVWAEATLWRRSEKMVCSRHAIVLRPTSPTAGDDKKNAGLTGALLISLVDCFVFGAVHESFCLDMIASFLVVLGEEEEEEEEKDDGNDELEGTERGRRVGLT